MTEQPAIGSQTNTTVPARPASYIPTLDGWRAIAVTLVIAAHSAVMLQNNGSWLALKAHGLVTHAGYGVDIFFALSGYLIATLLLREKERTGTISLSRFYLRRAFRILPPLLLYLGAACLLAALNRLPHISGSEALSVVLFFRNYSHGTWYTGHFWSLAVEEHFYLVAPVLILAFRRKWAVRILLMLIALCTVTRYLEFRHGFIADVPIQFRTENRCDALLWGCLLAYLLHSPVWLNFVKRRMNGFVFAGVALASPVLLAIFDSQPARRTLVAVLMPALIAFTITHPQTAVGRFLELPWLRWLGRISYSLYLWQMLFLPEAARPLGSLQAFPLALLLPVLCAAVSFYAVERPMMRLSHRLAASPGAVPLNRYDSERKVSFAGQTPEAVLQPWS